MLFLEAQDVAGLLVGERRFELAHRAGDWRVGAVFFQKFGGWQFSRDRVVHCIEHLEAQAIFLQSQMNDLRQIARIDIGPRIALAGHRILQEGREHRVFMRLDDIADAECVDIGLVTHREGPRGELVDDF